MVDLNNIYALVKETLEEDPVCRKSDALLYERILVKFDAVNGTLLGNIPVGLFLRTMHMYNAPKFESVRRARQKVMADYPSLKPDAETQEKRTEMQFEYSRFATAQAGDQLG